MTQTCDVQYLPQTGPVRISAKPLISLHLSEMTRAHLGVALGGTPRDRAHVVSASSDVFGAGADAGPETKKDTYEHRLGDEQVGGGGTPHGQKRGRNNKTRIWRKSQIASAISYARDAYDKHKIRLLHGGITEGLSPSTSNGPERPNPGGCPKIPAMTWPPHTPSQRGTRPPLDQVRGGEHVQRNNIFISTARAPIPM